MNRVKLWRNEALWMVTIWCLVAALLLSGCASTGPTLAEPRELTTIANMNEALMKIQASRVFARDSAAVYIRSTRVLCEGKPVEELENCQAPAERLLRDFVVYDKVFTDGWRIARGYVKEAEVTARLADEALTAEATERATHAAQVMKDAVPRVYEQLLLTLAELFRIANAKGATP